MSVAGIPAPPRALILPPSHERGARRDRRPPGGTARRHGRGGLDPNEPARIAIGLRGAVRSTLRVATALLLSLGLAPLPLAALLFSLGNPRRLATARLWTTRLWGRVLCRLLAIEVTVEGAPPEGPALLAPNHMGYLDLVVLFACCRTFFVSRADVRGWFLLGPLTRMVGTLYVERSRRKDAARSAVEIEERLRQGNRVTVYLEGGAGDGTELRRFRSPLLEAAVRAEVPCVPVALTYELHAGACGPVSRIVAWADATPFHVHVWRLASIPGLRAHLRFLPPRTGDDRKELAQALEDDVRAALSGDRSRGP